jgi:hypothetical protein
MSSNHSLSSVYAALPLLPGASISPPPGIRTPNNYNYNNKIDHSPNSKNNYNNKKNNAVPNSMSVPTSNGAVLSRPFNSSATQYHLQVPSTSASAAMSFVPPQSPLPGLNLMDGVPSVIPRSHMLKTKTSSNTSTGASSPHSLPNSKSSINTFAGAGAGAGAGPQAQPQQQQQQQQSQSRRPIKAETAYDHNGSAGEDSDAHGPKGRSEE